MKFWLGLLLSLFGGLIGIGLFREFIKSRCNFVDESILDVTSLIILLIGLVISAFDHSKQTKQLERLEKEQKGRVLKPNQKENLLKSLKNISKKKIVLMSIQGDRESFRFANSMKMIFLESDWEVEGVWEEIIIGGAGQGLLIRENTTELNSIGSLINEIMNKNDINSRVVIKSDIENEIIQIIVGSKP